MKKWQCRYCSFIYDEKVGIPEDGIAPGTSLIVVQLKKILRKYFKTYFEAINL